MEAIAKADVFFVVTTLFVGVLIVFGIIAGFYIIKILRNLRDVSSIVKSETLHIAGDVEQLRHNLKSEGMNIPGIFNFFKSILHRNHLNK